MLSALVALVSELGWMGARGWLAIQPGRQVARALTDLMFFSALTIGVIVLLLTPVVLRSRRALPPRGVTWFAVAVGALPLLAALGRLLG